MDYNWVKIAGNLPEGKELIARNTVAQLLVQGKKLYLANFNGSYYAGDARCPHAGGAMDRGWLNDNGQIVCPLHRFCFNLDNGHNTDGEGFSVQTYPIRKFPDGYYIGFPVRKWWFW